MNLIEICIAFVAAIVSVGTPLVFQVISKFDEKYRSEKIVNFFEKESNKKLFQGILVSTVIALFAYVLVSILFIHLNVGYLFWILQGASYFLLLSSAILVGVFIRFTFVTIQFSRPATLLSLLIKRNTLVGHKNNEIIDIILDFSVGAIQKKELPNFRVITNHFIDVFRNNKRDTGEPFSVEMYEIGYKITSELAANKHPDFDQFKYLTVNNLWILEIDKRAFDWLWQNLKIVIINKQDEMVYRYWRRAFQYFEYELRVPDAIYSSLDLTEKVNQNEIDKKENERAEFIDFHYYLGGLLLSENRIECIRKIWDHTNSEPPRYPLLPLAMGEIFNRYFKLCTTFDNELWEKAARFNFPANDSVNFDWLVNGWIQKYLVLLFLRQYTLHQYLMNQRFLELPKSPETQAEKKHWLDNLSWFRGRLEEYLADKDLMKVLRLDFVDEECSRKRVPNPLTLIDEFKTQLEADLIKEENEKEITIKEEKRLQSVSYPIIEKALREYEKIMIRKESVEYTDQYHDPFLISSTWSYASVVDLVDIPAHPNLEFSAERIASKIKDTISETFLIVTTKSYLLKEGDVFPAIKRLFTGLKPEEYLIVSFRNNIEYYRDVLKEPGLSENDFFGIELIDLWDCNFNIVGNTFFLLKKVDLPLLEFNEVTSEWGKEYLATDRISPDLPIYSAIFDLRKSHNESILSKLEKQGYHKRHFDKKALIAIEMFGKVFWKKDAKVVAIVLANAYEDKGLPNKLDDVIPFDKM